MGRRRTGRDVVVLVEDVREQRGVGVGGPVELQAVRGLELVFGLVVDAVDDRRCGACVDGKFVRAWKRAVSWEGRREPVKPSW